MRENREDAPGMLVHADRCYLVHATRHVCAYHTIIFGQLTWRNCSKAHTCKQFYYGPKAYTLRNRFAWQAWPVCTRCSAPCAKQCTVKWIHPSTGHTGRYIRVRYTLTNKIIKLLISVHIYASASTITNISPSHPPPKSSGLHWSSSVTPPFL